MSTELLKWVEHRYLHPVVIVESCAAVESACRRNGLDFIHLLRPFSVRNSPQYALVGDRGDSTLIRNFGIRLTRLEGVGELSNVQLLASCKAILSDVAATTASVSHDSASVDRLLERLTDERRGGPRVRPMLLDPSSELPSLLDAAFPRWHAGFVEQLHHLVRNGHVDTLDHPVGVVYAAASHEAGGLEGVLRVFQYQAARVRQIREGMPSLEGEFHEFFMILHDRAVGRDDGPTGKRPTLADAQQMLGALQQRYGVQYCALVTVNGATTPQERPCEEPKGWVAANPPFLDVPSGSGGQGGRSTTLRQVTQVIGKWANGTAKVTGCYLGAEDIASIRDAMARYIGQTLLKYVERRLRALDVVVQERRTTTLGKVAAWFKSNDDVKPRMEVFIPPDGSTPKYLASSLEMQMRRAGDLSLALRDFSGAANYYKMCLNELLETCPQRPYNRALIAGCQEGIGIARFLQGKLELPSSVPWYAGNTFGKNRSGSQNCRLELALNDFLISGLRAPALRVAFFLYEFSRTQMPPALDRARPILLHVLHSGITAEWKIFTAVMRDMLGSTFLFMNPPYSAGMAGMGGSGLIPPKFPIKSYVRTYIRYLVEASMDYTAAHLPELALRCCQRVLVLLRVLGRCGGWLKLFEHVIMSMSKLYFTLGYPMKGIVLAGAAIVAGTPMYSNRDTGLPQFMDFWEKQRCVLSDMGYSLCPHMIMPCILRESFYIEHNYYNEDEVTMQQEKFIGKEAAENEWRTMENITKNYYTNTSFKNMPQYRFPRFHGQTKPRYIFSSGAVSASTQQQQKQKEKQKQHPHPQQQQYTMPLDEPLWLWFSMHNPVGGVLTASNLCILYLSKEEPERLQKSTATKEVVLHPEATVKVSLAFSPGEPGEFFIIGIGWELLEQEGCYYFSTKEKQLGGGAEELYEYAIEHPVHAPEAVENIAVVVTAPRAWLSVDFQPPLPPRFHDGEYFHSKLVITNRSTQGEALWVTMQRSPQNAHLIWLEQFGLDGNLQDETPFVLAEHLEAGKSVRIDVVFRAQHSRGDAALRCTNHIFLLLAYLTKVQSLASVSSPWSSDAQSTLTTEGEFPASSLHPSGGAMQPLGEGVLEGGGTVRLHRLLRVVEVRPMMALYSTVIPPSNPSLCIAAALSMKNITGGVRAGVARVLALHHPNWVVRGTCSSEELAAACVVHSSHALTIALLLQRQPNDNGGEAAALGPANDASHARQLQLQQQQQEQEGEEGKGPCLVNTACFPLEAGLPSPSKAAALKQTIGAALADSPMNHYFLRTSFCGAGGVREARKSGNVGLAFYLDKANETKESMPQRRGTSEWQAGESCYRGPLEQYTPMAIAVAWVVDEEPNALPKFGQLFHLIDFMVFLQPEQHRCLAQSPSSFVAATTTPLQGNPKPPSLGLTPSTTEEAPALSSTASLEYQGKLCEALMHHRSVAAFNVDALVYHVVAPPFVCSTAALPTAAMALLSFRCLSLARVPLLVEVTAATGLGLAPSPLSKSNGTMSMPSPLLFFVGKTKFIFLLHPSAFYELSFTAQLLGPGLVDCNRFQVNATPCVLSRSEARRLPTGTSRRALLHLLREEMEQNQAKPFARLGTIQKDGKVGDTDGAGSVERNGNGKTDNGRELSNVSVCNGPVFPTPLTSISGGGDDVADKALLQRRIPRGFSREQLRVIGADVCVYTEARFAPLPTPSASNIGSASAASLTALAVARQEDYREDLHRYQQHRHTFQCSAAANTDWPVAYVYRPRIHLAQETTSPLPSSSSASSSSSSSSRLGFGRAEKAEAVGRRGGKNPQGAPIRVSRAAPALCTTGAALTGAGIWALRGHHDPYAIDPTGSAPVGAGGELTEPGQEVRSPVNFPRWHWEEGTAWTGQADNGLDAPFAPDAVGVSGGIESTTETT